MNTLEYVLVLSMAVSISASIAFCRAHYKRVTSSTTSASNTRSHDESRLSALPASK